MPQEAYHKGSIRVFGLAARVCSITILYGLLKIHKGYVLLQALEPPKIAEILKTSPSHLWVYERMCLRRHPRTSGGKCVSPTSGRRRQRSDLYLKDQGTS